jgi:flagellar hook assembly protein FlgD
VTDESSLIILGYNLTGIDADLRYAENLSLSANYPNPFNASTTIRYSLPEPAHVAIEVYDILGRRMQTLVREKKQAGYHSVVWNADGYSSGIYFYRIKAGEYSETKKMVLLK